MKHCNTCGEDKELTEFHKQSGKKDGLRSQCKKCTNKRNLSKYHSCSKTRGIHHLAARKHRLKDLYGITPEEYDRMFEKQKGVCKICETSCSSRKYLSVDHCHKTGLVRGLLCQACNTAIGLMREDTYRLQKAILYLESSEDDHRH